MSKAVPHPRVCCTEPMRALFVHHDTMVVLAASLAAASWMLSVLTNTAVAHRAMPPLLPVLALVRRLRQHADVTKRGHAVSLCVGPYAASTTASAAGELLRDGSP